jgi:RHS repeat-associated protein
MPQPPSVHHPPAYHPAATLWPMWLQQTITIPLGMQMPGRKYSNGSSYRYGFNGKEMDNEVSGEGNQYDYGMRIYNPRLGRFLSVDPLFQSYPWYTPYQFAGNTPIQAIDLDGMEEWVVTRWYDKDQNVTKIRIFTVVDNNKKSSHINLHFKDKNSSELAKGNKVLYLHLQVGTDKVFSAPTYESALTKDEKKIFDSKKKGASPEGYTHWSLEPAYKGYLTQDDDQLAEKYYEYNAFQQFKIQPPTPPKVATPNPPSNPTLPPLNTKEHGCFYSQRSDKCAGFDKVMTSFADYMKANPSANLTITLGGNHYDNILMKEKWTDGTGLLGMGSETYAELAVKRHNITVQTLGKLGISADRIKMAIGELKSNKTTYTFSNGTSAVTNTQESKDQ